MEEFETKQAEMNCRKTIESLLSNQGWNARNFYTTDLLFDLLEKREKKRQKYLLFKHFLAETFCFQVWFCFWILLLSSGTSFNNTKRNLIIIYSKQTNSLSGQVLQICLKTSCFLNNVQLIYTYKALLYDYIIKSYKTLLYKYTSAGKSLHTRPGRHLLQRTFCASLQKACCLPAKSDRRLKNNKISFLKTPLRVPTNT